MERRAGAETKDAKLADDRFRLLVEGVRDYGIFLLDPDGIITSWNSGAALIKGYTASEVIGRHFSIFYPHEALASGWPDEELRRARQNGRFEDEGWRVRKDGTRFWANVVITPTYAPDSTLIGFSKVTRDLTERRKHEEKLRRSEERFRLLVEGVKDYAIFMLNPDGTVATWNSGAERIKGYRAQDIIGKHFSVFYPADAIARKFPWYELEVAARSGRYEDEGWRLRKDGTRFWANVVITAVRSERDELLGFGKVTRDLTQQRRADALEEANRRNTEFLAMLAHELRNPLAPIHNAIGVMRMSEIADPEIRWSRDVIERQAAHLSRMVDDLLDVSRLTTGKVTLKTQSVDMRDVVQQAVESIRPAIEAYQHDLEVSVGSVPLPLQGDPTRLMQILTNLVNNSVKYTPPGGHIRVEARREGKEIVVSVQDSGVGISPELLPRIFELFVQGQRGLARSEGGLGIGLTMVQQLVNLHGGTIEARTRGPNQGSEFVVRLPEGSDQPAAASAATGPGGRQRYSDHRVLVVDDNRDSAESMAKVLELWGYPVRCAFDGLTAVETALDWHPRTVLLDLGLPGMDGFEVIERLRADERLRGAQVLAMTGYGKEDREKTTAAGFADHLVKPVDLKALRLWMERSTDPEPR